MQQRIKPSRQLLSLVSDFETMIKKGKEEYLTEKSYADLIFFYKDNFQIERAFQATEKALHQYPYILDFYVIKAKLYLNNREAHLALELIDEAFSFHPADRELSLLKSLALSKTGQFSEAFVILRELKSGAFNNDMAEIHLYESYVYEHTKDYDNMFNSLNECLLLQADYTEALERIWLATELSKKHEDSLRLHVKLTNEDPYNSLAWYNLGHSFAYQHIYGQAIDALEYAFLIDPDFEIAYRDCAEMCMETRKYRRALSILSEHMELFGVDSEVLVNIADCYIHLNKYARAKRYLTKAVKLDPYDDEAFYQLGICYAHDKQWDDSISYFQKALSLDDKREEYFAGLAECYFEKEEFVKANYYFRKATEIGPEMDEHWLSHASFLMRIGEVKEALKVLEEAEIHAVSAQLIYCRAACLLELGQRTDGLALLDEVMCEDFHLHTCLFDFKPQLKSDLDVQSIIRYYSE